MIKTDISELESFVQLLENAIEEMPKINKEFMQEEWYFFLDSVIPYSPYLTGELVNSYKMGEIKQEGTKTKADWMNIAKNPAGQYYASFPNYGTSRQAPQYFWERGLNHAEERRNERYWEMIENTQPS